MTKTAALSLTSSFLTDLCHATQNRGQESGSVCVRPSVHYLHLCPLFSSPCLGIRLVADCQACQVRCCDVSSSSRALITAALLVELKALSMSSCARMKSFLSSSNIRTKVTILAPPPGDMASCSGSRNLMKSSLCSSMTSLLYAFAKQSSIPMGRMDCLSLVLYKGTVFTDNQTQ